MATLTTIRVEGLLDIGKALKELGDEVTKRASNQAIRAAGAVVVKEAKRLVPVLKSQDGQLDPRWLPGTIRDNITTTRDKQASGPGQSAVIVHVKRRSKAQVAKQKKRAAAKGKAVQARHNDPYYWWWVEFGTQKMAARPFIRPAFEQTKQAQIEAARAALLRTIKRYKDRTQGAKSK